MASRKSSATANATEASLPTVEKFTADASPTEIVMLAHEGGQIGLVPFAERDHQGQAAASEFVVTVYARHPNSDEIIAEYEPQFPALSVRQQAVVQAIGKMDEATDEIIVRKMGNGALTIVGELIVLGVVIRNDRTVNLTAKGRAILDLMNPKKAKAATNGKNGKKDAPEAGSMAEKILALASRPDGVKRSELEAVTKWNGTPWKWYLSNPQGTGLADRYGYDLFVMKMKMKGEGKERAEAVHFLTLKAFPVEPAG